METEWTAEEMKKSIHDMAEVLKKHAGDVNALKVAQEKMKEELSDKLTTQENQFVEVKAELQKLTEEEEEVSRSVYEEAIGNTNKSVLSTLGYASKVESALYRPKTEFVQGKGFVKTGGYDVANEVMLMNDFCFLFGKAKAIHMNLSGNPTTYEDVVKSFDAYKLLKHELSLHPELRRALKAMDTTQNSDWVPTGMSAQLIDDIRMELRVAGLFRTITMPARSGSWDVPVQGSRLAAYKVAENTADSSQTAVGARTPSSGKITFTAIKHALRILWSYEMDEDSILAVMPFIRAEMVAALAGSWDSAIINGDITDGTHMDSDSDTATDIAKSFDGLRYHSDNSSGDAAVDIATINTANLRAIRKAMGKYGVRDCAWITGVSGYIQMLSLTEVMTVDKLGDKASLLKGQMAAFDGFPIVVSEFVREDLNASGVYDNSIKTKTVILLANTKAFWNGVKPSGIMVETDRNIENQQNIAVASHRLDFKRTITPTSGYNVVGVGYNLTS